MIWWYLVISCFNWKIVVFQQTVVRVYYILNKKATIVWQIFDDSGTFAPNNVVI